MQHNEGRPWRKVLYEPQGSGDDAYTTDAFLEALVVNATVARRSYSKVVWDSLPLSQQLSTVTLVSTASYLLTQGRLSAWQLLAVQLLLGLVGCTIFSICSAPGRKRRHLDYSQPYTARSDTPSGSPGLMAAACSCHAQQAGQARRRDPGACCRRPVRQLFAADGATASCCRSRSCLSRWLYLKARRLKVQLAQLVRPAATAAAFVGGTLVLSPLYASLAQSISTDTIVFLTTVLLAAHLFLWDYGFDGTVRSRWTGVSLGCALLATILCASRDGSSMGAFAQVLLALEAFTLFPQLRHKVQIASPAAHAALTLCLLGASVALLLPLNVLLATTCLCVACFVCLICPMWLVRVGKFKAQINGPWDEAVPKLARDVSLRVASPRRMGPSPRRVTI